jgi:hypothetical protein
MTAIEHKELKGITVKNLVVTIMGTASIVTSVMTTYFGLKNDIRDISILQKTEERINNIRIKVLEDHIVLLQNEVDEIKYNKIFLNERHKLARKSNSPVLLGSVTTPASH